MLHSSDHAGRPGRPCSTGSCNCSVPFVLQVYSADFVVFAVNYFIGSGGDCGAWRSTILAHRFVRHKGLSFEDVRVARL